MRIYYTIFAIFLVALGSSSCDIINPKEQVPSYIGIYDISLLVPSQDEGVFGSDSENITDVWLYTDNQLIGAFELPAVIPVLYEGMQNIKAYAGIKVNGISNSREIYPFYSYYEINMELIPGAVNTITPVVKYITESLAIDQERF